jgi:hypothetical protein
MFKTDYESLDIPESIEVDKKEKKKKKKKKKDKALIV